MSTEPSTLFCYILLLDCYIIIVVRWLSGLTVSYKPEEQGFKTSPWQNDGFHVFIV